MVNATVNGNYLFEVNSANGTTINGAIGGSNAVGSFDALGQLLLSSGLVNSTGTQTYNGSVTLGANTVLNSTNSLVNFLSALNQNGIPYNLTINTGAGDIALGQINSLGGVTLNTTQAANLNGTVNAMSLATEAGGMTNIQSGQVITSGAQNYQSAVSLGANTTLTANGITLGNALTGNSHSLNLDDSSMTVINNTVSNVSSLTANSVDINNGGVSTMNNQTYNGLVELGNNATLSTMGSGNNTIAINNGLSGGGKDLDVIGSANGTNTFVLNSGNNQNWIVNSNNTGYITGTTANVTFSNTQNLVGGNNNDNFMLSGGSVGQVNGGAGNNSVVAGNTANTWMINGTNAGSVNDVSGFSNIQNVNGGTSNNVFNLAGGSLSGNIVGGTGANTLNVSSANSTLDITGTNQGTVTGVGGNFSNIQNLNASGSSNQFIFANNATITGSINGVSLANTNVANFTGYTTPINVALSATNNGVSTNGATTVANFDNVTDLEGNGSLDNYITLPSTGTNTVTLTGPKSGIINDPITFNGFLVFRSVTGLDTANITVPATIDQATGTVTINGVTMQFINFASINGIPTSPPPVPPVSVSTSNTAVQSNIILPANVSNVVNENDSLYEFNQPAATKCDTNNKDKTKYCKLDKLIEVDPAFDLSNQYAAPKICLDKSGHCYTLHVNAQKNSSLKNLSFR
jgi:hypothetical protein